MTVSDFKDLHCLIVDDDGVFLKVLEALLKSLGVGKVTCARNGSEALTTLSASQRTVDVILADLKMVAGNGLQDLKAVRTGQNKYLRPDTCFIMLSALAEPYAIKAAAMLDAQGYLVKPLTLEKLRIAIVEARKSNFAVDLALYAPVRVPSSEL